MPSTSRTEKLITIIEGAFGYTSDNNRDLISDPTFTQAEVTEELIVEFAKDFLISYASRNEEMLEVNLEDIL